MRQLRYCGSDTFRVFDVDSPPPTPGQVRVDVAYSGICGTDLHIAHGHMDARVRPPAVIGHEMSGRVGALGPEVTGWSVDDPASLMLSRAYGTCPVCAGGHPYVCPDLTVYGVDAPGCMQQHWLVPATSLVALPGDLDLMAAALVEPTAVAVHDVARAGVQAGDQVLVVGGGPVGLLIAVVARAAGADVMVSEPDPGRRTIAADAGLRTVDPAGVDPTVAVSDWTGGAGVPVSFEVSSAPAGLNLAVEALAVRGRLCLVAIHAEPAPVDLNRMFLRELSVVGARLYQRADYERAVELVADGTVPTKDLISRVEPLTNGAAAFAALAGGGGVMKVLIDCQAA